MRRLVPTVLLASLVLTGAPAGVAGGSEVVVDATDQGAFDLFLPSLIDVARGGTVRFEFDDGARSHTATDGTGLDLYDSGVVSPGGPDEVVTFVAAGNYAVSCTLHAGMGATVFVPVSVSPTSGASGTTLTIRWASVVASGGLVVDVQIRKPGSDTWVAWRGDVATTSAEFHPGAGPGTYRFRARVERIATGTTSDWSPSDTAKVG